MRKDTQAVICNHATCLQVILQQLSDSPCFNTLRSCVTLTEAHSCYAGTYFTAGVRAAQDSCTVAAAAAAAAGPVIRDLMSHSRTGEGLNWVTLQGQARALLSDADRRRLQPMFQQVRRLPAASNSLHKAQRLNNK